MRIWTAEARAAQSALMKRLKPWTKSTGPRTPEGKAKAARNSLKTGAYTKEHKQIRRFFRDCRAFLKFLKTEYYKPVKISDRSAVEAQYRRPANQADPLLYVST